MNNCLTCEYEPEWSEWTKGEYSRCSGKCQWPGGIPDMPKTYILQIKAIVRYTDDSGIEHNCKTWKAKAQ